MIKTLKRWHRNAPAPVIWLLAALLLYAWLLLVSFALTFLAGGTERVAEYWPGYAVTTAKKLAFLYVVAVGLYVVYRLAAALSGRSSGDRR